MELFKVIGISFQNTPIEVREFISLDENSAKFFLKRCEEVLGIQEIMILSTCNRTEIYYNSENDYDEQLISLLSSYKGVDGSSVKPYFQGRQALNAVNHLFEVALGLDSKVLGDIQITNQVKRAYQWSSDEGLAGPFLHRLMHTIFFTNKRVVQETGFRDGTASLSSVAIELTKHFTMNFIEPKVAVLGLGEIGEDVAENLKGFVGEVTLLNRTESKSLQMAKSLGFESRPYNDLEEVLSESDVVISAIRSENPVILYEHLKSTTKHKMVIDLAVPRSVEEGVDQIKGLLYYNVDQLEERTKGAVQKRQGAIPHVRAIIEESMNDFNNWSQEMEVSPTIQKLKSALEDIRQQEIARYVGKIDDQQQKLLDQATKSMIQKVIKLPVLQLKAACKRGEAETLVGVLNDLFNLEKDQKKVK